MATCISTVHIQKTGDGKRFTGTSLEVNEKILHKVFSRVCLQNKLAFLADGKTYSKDFWAVILLRT